MASVDVDDDDSLLADADIEIVDGEESGPPPEPFEARQARACFQKYDKDGSGSIDLKELNRLLNDMFAAAHVDKKRRERIVQKYIKDYDVNGDGLISWEEFNDMFDKEDFVYIEPAKGGKHRKASKSSSGGRGSGGHQTSSTSSDADLYSLNPFGASNAPTAHPAKPNAPGGASSGVSPFTQYQHSLGSGPEPKDLPQMKTLHSSHQEPSFGDSNNRSPGGQAALPALGGTGLPSLPAHLPQLGPSGRQADSPEFFDIYIAYNPANGEDLAQSLKLQLELHDPALNVYVDVDGRTHANKQQEIAASSANYLLFITEGVLAVPAVHRTLTGAVRAKKNVVLVHDVKSCSFPTDNDIPSAAPAEFKQLAKQVLTLHMAITYQRERILRDAVVQEITAKLVPRKGRISKPAVSPRINNVLPGSLTGAAPTSKLSSLPRRAIYSPVHSHPLAEFASVALLAEENRDYAHGYQCSVCANNFTSGKVYHCRTCFYDVCARDLK